MFFRKKIKDIGIDYNNLPEHIGVIMDGNGRWAKKRGLPRSAGHQAGADTLKKIVTECNKMGIKYITVYAFSTLGPENLERLNKYSDIIVQTTSKGMGSNEPSNQDNDPIWFYDFSGKEFVYDVIYSPEVTPVMARADASGCSVCNGASMLLYQGISQFELYRQRV